LKDSSATERLDPRNGLATCPSHDVAFDPPVLDTLLLPDHAERPQRKYLDWRREKVFVA
jgi:hypothetical protein